MRINHLSLTNFRGFKEQTFEFAHRVNLLVGDNATGKSAVVDAARLVLTCYLNQLPPPASTGLELVEYDVRHELFMKGQTLTRELQYPCRVRIHTYPTSPNDSRHAWEIERTPRSTQLGGYELEALAIELRNELQAGRDIAFPLFVAFGTERLPGLSSLYPHAGIGQTEQWWQARFRTGRGHELRPVTRGPVPLRDDGDEVEYSDYKDARDDLIDRMGDYCSYCEVALHSAVDVEHVLPKSLNPTLELSWENFLLACGNCNSIKGNKPVVLANFYWPDQDNTLRAFIYEQDEPPQVSADPAVDLARAQQTIELTGLDRVPGHPKYSDRDRRWKKRFEVWSIALQIAVLAIRRMSKPETAFQYGNRTNASNASRTR